MEYLLKALEEAKKRKGYTSPNPSVGAVLVKNSRIIGTGYHYGPGHPHAEVNCIENANEDVTGATLFVTLEPCCFYGRTPPCTEYLINKRIKEVYYGFTDPNSKVSGKGEKTLNEAGITCKKINIPEINEHYESYSHWIKTSRPFVTLKLAMSLNGKASGPNGRRVKFTGKTADEFTHTKRNSSDAILTSINTVINDNPRFDVRLSNESIKKPVYILDRKLKFNTSFQVFEFAKEIIVFHGHVEDPTMLDILTKSGIKRHLIRKKDGLLNLTEVIECIGKDGIHDLWVEVGPKMVYGLIKENLINRMYIYIAPKILSLDSMNAFFDDIFKNVTSLKWGSLGNDALLEVKF